MPFRSLAPQTLPRQVARAIVGSILVGHFQSGEPLPAAGDIAREFEVSLPVVREALKIVATLGPGRVICVAKEVTKLHETFFVGPAADVQARLARASLRGEFVLLIAPADFVL